MKTLDFSVQDTNVLKGIALLLLLAHHLFCILDGSYKDFVLPNGIHVLYEFSSGFAKVCVALFVFLSGYGLSKSSIKLEGGIRKKYLVSFYARRIVKLMMNYWLIWLLFVPIGILVFHRTFPDVYGYHYIIKAVIDFFGLAYAFGFWGYNVTWWFYSCIIVLYVIFPFLFVVRNRIVIIVVYAIIISLLGSRVYILKACTPYHLSFILGILMASHKTTINYKLFFLWIVGIFVVGILRIIGFWGRVWQDVILCYLIAVAYSSSNMCIWSKKILSYLGKHSFNIFIFHTFIYSYYFHNYIYWSSNPIIIYLMMLSTCLVLSIGIEKLKRRLSFYKIQNYLIDFLNQDIS